jgi:predicted phosphodiesterase
VRLAVFADVHGNLPALEAMLTDVGSADGYICVGDIVNYGPWSDECVELVLSLPNVEVVEGNHERDFTAGWYSGGSSLARAFFEFCRPRFHSFELIRGLPESLRIANFLVRHTIGNRNIYVDTDLELDDNYVVGHSHHQFEIAQPPLRLVNPGSVGQNRGCIDIVNYATLETEGMQFEFHSVAINVDHVIAEMERQGYPGECVKYYRQKPRFLS